MRFGLISFGRVSRAPMRVPHDRHTEIDDADRPAAIAGIGVHRARWPRGRATDADRAACLPNRPF